MATYYSPFYYPCSQPQQETLDFSGVDIEGWLNRIEIYFDQYQMTPAQRLAAVGSYLNGEALEWFNQWYRNMYWSGHPASWEIFVVDLQLRFNPPEPLHHEPDRGEILLKMLGEVTQLMSNMKRQNSLYMDHLAKLKPSVSPILDSGVEVEQHEFIPDNIDELIVEEEKEAKSLVVAQSEVNSLDSQYTVCVKNESTAENFAGNEISRFEVPVCTLGDSVSLRLPSVRENARLNFVILVDILLSYTKVAKYADDSVVVEDEYVKELGSRKPPPLPPDIFRYISFTHEFSPIYDLGALACMVATAALFLAFQNEVKESGVDDIYVDSGSATSFCVVDNAFEFCTQGVCKNVREMFWYKVLAYLQLVNQGSLWAVDGVSYSWDWFDKPSPVPPDIILCQKLLQVPGSKSQVFNLLSIGDFSICLEKYFQRVVKKGGLGISWLVPDSVQMEVIHVVNDQTEGTKMGLKAFEELAGTTHICHPSKFFNCSKKISAHRPLNDVVIQFHMGFSDVIVEPVLALSSIRVDEFAVIGISGCMKMTGVIRHCDFWVRCSDQEFFYNKGTADLATIKTFINGPAVGKAWKSDGFWIQLSEGIYVEGFYVELKSTACWLSLEHIHTKPMKVWFHLIEPRELVLCISVFQFRDDIMLNHDEVITTRLNSYYMLIKELSLAHEWLVSKSDCSTDHGMCDTFSEVFAECLEMEAGFKPYVFSAKRWKKVISMKNYMAYISYLAGYNNDKLMRIGAVQDGFGVCGWHQVDLSHEGQYICVLGIIEHDNEACINHESSLQVLKINEKEVTAIISKVGFIYWYSLLLRSMSKMMKMMKILLRHEIYILSEMVSTNTFAREVNASLDPKLKVRNTPYRLETKVHEQTKMQPSRYWQLFKSTLVIFFSFSRPPEVSDLEDKVSFKAGGMMRNKILNIINNS